MFQQIRFPPEALDDVRALVNLEVEQLRRLSKLLDSKDAAPPIDDSFEDQVAKRLDLSADTAESVVRVAIVLQSLDLSQSAAKEGVQDIEELVRSESQEDTDDLLAQVESKRDELIAIAKRKQTITRELDLRRIAVGTQPAIDAIRTLVQLRPLYERDEDHAPIDVECLVPAMTLEMKYRKDERSHSATFSLSEATLDELISSLEDAREKWKILKNKYSDQFCE